MPSVTVGSPGEAAPPVGGGFGLVDSVVALFALGWWVGSSWGGAVRLRFLAVLVVPGTGAPFALEGGWAGNSLGGAVGPRFWPVLALRILVALFASVE